MSGLFFSVCVKIMSVMKKQKKYTIPVKESYQSVLDDRKRRILNSISYLTCVISLISAILLLRVSNRTFNMTPAAVTLYVCEIIMAVSMILSIQLDLKSGEIVGYPALMRSHGLLMIAGLAGMLFGLASFQKQPVSMLLLWVCIIASGITGICSAVVYTSYQKVKK